MNALIWFRNDLRLQDNYLLEVAKAFDNIYGLYIFDDREFSEHALGFKKTGSFRASFLIESVSVLDKNMAGQLIVRHGSPVPIIIELAKKLNIQTVLASKEVTDEEVKIEKELKAKLSYKQIDLKLLWQSTLYHIEDLPIPVSELPDVFTQFRKAVEKKSTVRETVATQATFTEIPEHIEKGRIPDLTGLGYEPIEADTRAAVKFEGGEGAAMERLRHYFWDTKSLSKYKYTRNGLIGPDYSSKFSPWLSLGCISPRTIFEEVKNYEKQIIKNSSTYWLVFELIWRDYFRFVAHKYGCKIFQFTGLKGRQKYLYDHPHYFNKWTNGETGVDFIDANMIELRDTGFMSNRGRQNVAGFLVHDLEVNWTWGAAYFESQLVDYDPCSNWGNWCYIAGVGNDPREDRYFNIEKQANNYDPDGSYRRLWLSP